MLMTVVILMLITLISSLRILRISHVAGWLSVIVSVLFSMIKSDNVLSAS